MRPLNGTNIKSNTFEQECLTCEGPNFAEATCLYIQLVCLQNVVYEPIERVYTAVNNWQKLYMAYVILKNK